mgnify:FL=1
MSSYNSTSAYPQAVDDIMFISDVSLDTIGISRQHNNLTNNGSYTKAHEYINSLSAVTPVDAGFFNMLENRIYQTQLFVKALTKTVISFYGDSQPDNPAISVWISGSISE